MTTSSKRRRRRRGFTLIEVLLVLTILVIIASLAVVNYNRARRGAKMDAALLGIKALETPLELYANDVGNYPETNDGLEALVYLPTGLTDETKWNGPYLKRSVPLDPWGNPYQYEWPARNQEDFPDIWSFGPDGRDQSGDEIANWMEE